MTGQEYKHEWYLKNKERCSEKHNKYYKLHREELLDKEKQKRIKANGGIYRGKIGKWMAGRYGEESNNWKGGKPKCPICGKEIFYGAKHCPKHKSSPVLGKRWKLSPETIAKRIGKKLSESTKEKLRIAMIKRNENGGRVNQFGGYKGGITWRDKHSLCSPEYVKWRATVLRRDDFKCRIGNNDCKGQVQVHHILPWRDFIKLRFNINNGITLCHAHHPRKRAEEKLLMPVFQELVEVSNITPLQDKK